jgi:NDP-sugar pyrophosphorylase family protein
MINILIPIAGDSAFFDSHEYPYPKPLVEIKGTPMIELVIKKLSYIDKKLHFIFVVKNEDCTKYHLDNTLRLITNNNCTIYKTPTTTKGAACSSLLAVEKINNKTPLIILNGDQIIDHNISSVLNYFEQKKADAGVVCFESVHPKWSYARIDEKNNVLETAEKIPISKNAIAGFYYFSHGSIFVESAYQSIINDSSVDNLFYIAPCMNELILKNKNVMAYKIQNKEYHSFYSPQKIKEYEQLY